MIKIFRKKGRSIFRRKKRNVLAVFLHGWGKGKKGPCATITSYPVRKLGKHETEDELFSKTEDDWRKELAD